MKVICPTAALRIKYGKAAEKILDAIHELGSIVEVDGTTPEQIQQKIATVDGSSLCLVGGYDLIPPFIRTNPTHGSMDDDGEIPTDAPYGASAGHPSAEYAPDRAVSRIPDGHGADAKAFIALIKNQAAVAAAQTPKGTYEEAAAEFEGALSFVRKAIPGTHAQAKLSPPQKLSRAGAPGPLEGCGRIHILLHGANFAPDWAYLWGHDGAQGSPFIKALSAAAIAASNLQGSVVTFSSCYSAMLDVAPAAKGARDSHNQVALACLARGAKLVFGATRSNWISMSAPFDGFGPQLVAEVWRHLAAGKAGAEALRLAKASYLKDALSGPAADRPYALKTVLQAQCYGHANARL